MPIYVGDDGSFVETTTTTTGFTIDNLTLSSAPSVASTPTAGAGVALTSSGTLPTSAPATALQILTADPINPAVGQVWYRADTSQLCIRHDSGTTKRSAAFT